MNKIKAVWKDGRLIFNHFVVKKGSDSFIGVASFSLPKYFHFFHINFINRSARVACSD